MRSVGNAAAGDRLAAKFLLCDRYELQSVLGRGATAVVFQAFDRRLARAVAVKIWSPEAGGRSGWWRERDRGRGHVDPEAFFMAEAHRLATLHHPGLAAIFDFALTHEGVPWLAMELLPGRTLRRLIGYWAHDTPSTLHQVLSITSQVAAVTAYLHDQGLYQLDLKPENVIVDEAGRVTVIDIATALERPSDEYRLRRARYGTPGYVAPEVVLGHVVGPDADSFSVGAILLEVLTLGNPLADAELREAAYRALGVREVQRFLDNRTMSFIPDYDGEVRVWGRKYERRVASLDIAAALRRVRFPVPERLVALISSALAVDVALRPSSDHVLAELTTVQDSSSEAGRVFISHAHEDKARFVDGLAQALARTGVAVWYDSWDLRVGQPFWDHIMEAVDSAAFVVVVFSKHALRSDGVAEELRVARLESTRRVKILPIVIDDLRLTDLPPDVRARHVMRFPLPDDRAGFAAALNRLLVDMRHLGRHTG
jgi:serine/threonine protein kinase